MFSFSDLFENIINEAGENKGLKQEKGVAASDMSQVKNPSPASDHQKQTSNTQSDKSLNTAFKDGKKLYTDTPKGPKSS